MAAGLGFKDFVTGEVLTAADVDGYLMQGTWVFASAAARSAAVTSPQEGNMSYLKDTNSTEYYSGSAWVSIGGASGGMTLLSTTSLTGNSVTISSISGSHKILYLVGRNIVSSANENVQIRFNSDSGSNYAWTRIRVTGTSDTYTNATGNTSIDLMEDFTNTDFNRAGFFQFTIPRYSETEIKAFYFNSLGSTSTQRKVDWVQGTYNSTSAISSITILNEAGGTNFSSGTVYVYGVS